MPTPRLTGSMPALVTPMQADGSVDYAALDRLVGFHRERGSQALVSVGTTGESATLDMDEHMQVIARTVEYAGPELPVIAGTGGNSTSEALELTGQAAKLGVAACLLVVPYYNKPTQEGLFRHFSLIADQVEVPQILYNVPKRTALDMHNDTVVRLAEHPNIAGLKDATGEIDRVVDLRRRCGEAFGLYSGDDATTLEFLKAGGDGCISVTANVAPGEMQALCAAMLAGDTATAEQINARLDPVHAALFCESSPIPVKWAVAELGLAGPSLRLPLTELSADARPRVRAALVEAGLLN